MATDDRREPFTNMRFRVEIDSMQGTGAVAVIFPEARIVLGPRKAIVTQYGSLILKRGLTRSGEWYEWWDAARKSSGQSSNGQSKKGQSKRRRLQKNVRVILIDSQAADANQWLFSDTTPVAYHVSSLNALGNEPLIETLELSVGDFRAVYS
jgi:phage tail-like protein